MYYIYIKYLLNKKKKKNEIYKIFEFSRKSQNFINSRLILNQC